jgi:hypothetical protein
MFKREPEAEDVPTRAQNKKRDIHWMNCSRLAPFGTQPRACQKDERGKIGWSGDFTFNSPF